MKKVQMKRTLPVLLAMIMVLAFTLSACGGGDDIQTRTAEHINGRQCFDFFKTIGQKYGDFLAHVVLL